MTPHETPHGNGLLLLDYSASTSVFYVIDRVVLLRLVSYPCFLFYIILIEACALPPT